MEIRERAEGKLSPWWRNAVILILAAGFTVLIWMAVRSYTDAPPIPGKVVTAAGEVVFTREDILGGQEVFLKYGLMENGSLWGHGAYLGPDFSAEYLHALGLDVAAFAAREKHGRDLDALDGTEKSAALAAVAALLKQNRYDPGTDTLTFTSAEAASFQNQIGTWTRYFMEPGLSRGLRVGHIRKPGELRQLTAFFAWTAWASVANRPGKDYSYTNNFPYDPLVGNTATSDAILWSALSLITLLAGTAMVLFAFGRFDFLGWKGTGEHIHPQMLPGVATESQRATIKYFVVVALLFLAQVLVGGATAHYRADPGSFYGIDLSAFFPSNILRTWHLQLAIFWIATAYVAGGLFLAPALGGKEPKGQAWGVNLLFGALVVVVVGQPPRRDARRPPAAGQALVLVRPPGMGVPRPRAGLADPAGRGAGLLARPALPGHRARPARTRSRGRSPPSSSSPPWRSRSSTCPALFFGSTTHFTVVDTWRFWIIHLWVEGFFELFVTVMVAVIFYKLGMVSRQTATRVIYLDAILFLGSGIVGTGHHWYWTGQSNVTMALAAIFSAMEVVPLTLLTLDAWDFIKLTRGTVRRLRQGDRRPAQVDLLLPDGRRILELRRRRRSSASSSTCPSSATSRWGPCSRRTTATPP